MLNDWMTQVKKPGTGPKITIKAFSDHEPNIFTIKTVSTEKTLPLVSAVLS